MNYYTPRNPNHALLPKRKKHPVRRALRITGIVILTLLLVLSLTFTVCIAAVRKQKTCKIRRTCGRSRKICAGF